MKDFDFSIIIPCYNSANFILKALTSLESQTYKNFEVICIDDCSIDNTYGVLINYQKTLKLEMKVLKNDINSGPGVSRNIGIAISKGEYICFLDSDDWYDPNLLNELNIKIQEEKFDIILFDRVFVFKNGKILQRKNTYLFTIDTSKKNILANISGSLCLMCVKRELFRDICIPKIYYGEDNAISPVLISKSNKICALNKAFYYNLYRKDSLSNNKNKKIADSFINSFNFIQKNIQDKDSLSLEIEFIGIKIILYAAILNAVQSWMKIKEINNIITDFEEKNKDWRLNKYIIDYPFRKRFFLKLVQYKLYFLLYFYGQIHKLLLRLK